MKVLINEIFHSFQGEGPMVGKPAVFVRLGGCNLRCAWCDSRFTWNPDVQDNRQMDTDEVISEIKKYDCRHLVITGGEPLLQQRQIKEIMKKLKGYTAELETNGSLVCEIDEYFTGINCSPKLSNSGNKPYKLKIDPENPKVIFKFVVCSPSDLGEINEYVFKQSIPPEKVYLMPEGVTRKSQIQKIPWIIEKCRVLGYNFSLRLHIMLYENERGK